MKKEEKLDYNQSRKRKNSGSEFMQRYFTLFILFAFLNLSIGCTNYYKVNTIRTNYSEETESMRLQNKLFILDDGTDRYWLNFIRINDDNTGIYARINPIPFQIEKSILQQVQIHTNKYTKLEDSEVFIPFYSISSIKTYEIDRPRTVTSNAISFIAFTGIALYWILKWKKENWGTPDY